MSYSPFDNYTPPGPSATDAAQSGGFGGGQGSYPQLGGGPLAGSGQAVQLYQSIYGPQTTALGEQARSIQERIAAQQMYGAMGADSAQRQYDSALGLLGVDQSNNAVNRGSIDRLLGLYDQQVGQYRSLYDSQNAQARAQAAQQTWDLNSKTTAQGGWGSEGQRTGLNTIDQLMQQAIAGNEAQFGIQQNQATMSKERLATQRRELENQAGAYGLKADQLQANLDAGLSKLGLDNIMSTGSLMDMLSSNSVQQATLARTIIDQALNTPQSVLDYLSQNPDLFGQMEPADQTYRSDAMHGVR